VIHRVRLRRFKRFGDVEFVLPGHVVLAGPNNMGKTTVLQAIAAWSLALGRWKQLNDFQRHGGAYTRAPSRDRPSRPSRCARSIFCGGIASTPGASRSRSSTRRGGPSPWS